MTTYASHTPSALGAEPRPAGVAGAIRGGTLLLAAAVSALVVVAHEVIEPWSQAHLLASWVALWAVAFAALALFARPARRLANSVRTIWRDLVQAEEAELIRHLGGLRSLR